MGEKSSSDTKKTKRPKTTRHKKQTKPNRPQHTKKTKQNNTKKPAAAKQMNSEPRNFAVGRSAFLSLKGACGIFRLGKRCMKLDRV
jgi:hypothetical protein